MADGDEAALAALYDGWAGRVHTLALWILKDPDDAEDVVEETFWQAWRTASRYDGQRASGSTWLMMIARSRALDRLRARRRWADWSGDPANTHEVAEGRSAAEIPDARSEAVERQDAVALAMQGLPPEQREALELAFFAGLSHSEISSRLAQPLGTVKTRIRLAMQKLRQGLDSLREGGS
ncbi:MAG TPA: sigma-70 family RNA polymerase sigma factor [Gemmatimonadales bacterium]